MSAGCMTARGAKRRRSAEFFRSRSVHSPGFQGIRKPGCLTCPGKNHQPKNMTDRELRKLEGTIRAKMEDIRKQRVSLRDSGIGSLMNLLKKVDEALYEKILPEYKKMVSDFNIFK